jgi:hypothetical protein
MWTLGIFVSGVSDRGTLSNLSDMSNELMNVWRTVPLISLLFLFRLLFPFQAKGG